MKLRRFSKTDKLLRYRTLIQKMYPLRAFAFTRAKWKWMHRYFSRIYRHRITRYNRSISFRNFRRQLRKKTKGKFKSKLTVRLFYIKLKSKIEYPRKKIKNFFPILSDRISIREWNKDRHLYRENLKLKRSLSLLSDFTVNFSRIKQQLKLFKLKDKKRLHFFLHTYYKLDFLLWSLGYCKSRLLIRYYITQGKILVNDDLVPLNYFLKAGDVITFVNNKFYMKEMIKYYKSESILSFIECDYYSNTLIITKDLKELTNFDLTSVLREPKIKILQ